MSQSDSVTVRIAPEDTIGTIPAGTAPNTLCVTNVDGQQTAQTTQSSRNCGSTNAPQVTYRTSDEGNVTIGLEVAYDEASYLIPAALHATGSDYETESGSAVLINDGTLSWSAVDTLTGAGDFTTSIAAGDLIYVGGFADDIGNGMFRVNEVAATTITVETYGGLRDGANGDTVVAQSNAGAGHIILTGRALNGTDFKTFSIEIDYGLGGTEDFHMFTGMAINSAALNIAANGLATLSFEFVGTGTSSSKISGTTQFPTAPNAALSSAEPFNTADSFVLFNEDGRTSAAPYCMNNFSLTLTRNVSIPDCVGREATRLPRAGSFEISGSMSLDFSADNSHLLKDFLDNNSTGITFLMPGPTGGAYGLELRKMVLTGVTNPVGGPNSDVNLEVSYSGANDDDGFAINWSKFDGVTYSNYLADLAQT